MTFLSKYYKSFLLSVESSMEYRTNFFMNIFSSIFMMVAQGFLWTAIFNSTTQKIIYGYTYTEMMTYTIMAGIISKLVSASFGRQIASDIKSGGLNKFLVQPIDYMNYNMSVFLGKKVSESGFILIFSLIIIFLCNSFWNFNISLINFLCVIVPILLAIIINFFIFYCLSSLAFLMTEVSVLFFGLDVITSILSGAYFPIDIFGEKVLYIINLLPFQYTLYFPLNVMNGRISGQGLLLGVAIQIAWIMILYLLARLLWRIGIKKYIAIGG